MPSPALAVVLSALVGAAIVLLAWAASNALSRQAATDARLAALEQELVNLKRVRQNKLYRMALEDVGFAASQAALRVRALRTQMIDELAVVEAILNREPSP